MRRGRPESSPTISRFWNPVSSSSRLASWPVTPMAARTAGASRITSWPATRAVPASATVIVVRIRTVVLLPGAVGPEQAEDLAARDHEADAVDRDGVAVVLRRGRGLDDRLLHTARLRPAVIGPSRLRQAD